MSFPTNFTWGVAAASYQIEGAWDEDGKGLSVWDMLVRQPGKIWEGHTGNVACDHYYRYKEDVSLMREIGVNAYRLSVAWPRVLPEGRGSINAQGYKHRFGLIHVDFGTQKRTLKDSAFWYREVIRTNGGNMLPGDEME